MDRPYLQDLWIKNYGCAQDVRLTLSPLHALIGPNDSGKTTILRAIQSIAYLTDPHKKDDGTLQRAMFRSTQNAESLIGVATQPIERQSPLPSPAILEAKFSQRVTNGATVNSYWQVDGPEMGTTESTGLNFSNLIRTIPPITTALHHCTMVRLDPDSLRVPRALLQEGAPLGFVDDRGLGLPAVYDAIQNRDIEAFLTLNAEITKLFPDVKSVRLVNETSGTKAIGVQLKNGTFIPAEAMSEGLLYYLAFAALRCIDPPAILLIEEPENGLHPARIAEVMRVLRELSKTTQIILATHSPLVINELEAHEVSVITRNPETGTRAKLIKDTANFEERSKVYALGELWLSYANGIDEAPLISGGPRP
jgi:energy-coupling factor transporter ATP-binding protein EcfA2